MRELFVTLVGVLVFLATCSGETCETAQRWGFICLTDDTTATCVFNGNQFVAIGRVDCDVGMYCNEDAKNCTIDYAENFQCHSTGFYADLFNCRKYLYCPKPYSDAYSLDCPAGMMFSPATGCCSQQFTEASCFRRKVSCETGAKVVAWPENNNYFYSCVKILPHDVWYPQLVKCPDRQVFSGTQCVNGSWTSNPSTPSIPSGPSTPNVDSGSCEPGSFAANDQNCRQYFYCNVNRVWVSYNCGTNGIFDLASKRCRIGNCLPPF